MTRRYACASVVSVLMFASCLLLAQNQPTPPFNTQGVTPPPGTNPTPARMTFFVTSVGLGKGGDLGGLAGADAHCQTLAAAVRARGRPFHHYLTHPGRRPHPRRQ